MGIDLDTALLEAARTEAAARGLDHVSLRVDAVEGLAESGFDLACARFLPMHLRDPTRVASQVEGRGSQARRHRRSGGPQLLRMSILAAALDFVLTGATLPHRLRAACRPFPVAGHSNGR